MMGTNSEHSLRESPQEDVEPVAKDVVQKGSILQMYQFLDRRYYVLLFIGTISSIGAGMLTLFQHYIACLMTREVNEEDNLSSDTPRETIAGKPFLSLKFDKNVLICKSKILIC